MRHQICYKYYPERSCYDCKQRIRDDDKEAFDAAVKQLEATLKDMEKNNETQAH